MIRDPPDVRYQPEPIEPTWQGVLASYATIAIVLLLMWAFSDPVTAVVTLTTGVGLFVGTRRSLSVIRCFRECGGFAFNLGNSVHICVARPNVTDSP
jgi:uncharacterized membrane protein YdfJ with MMPL/SSD domain